MGGGGWKTSERKESSLKSPSPPPPFKAMSCDNNTDDGKGGKGREGEAGGGWGVAQTKRESTQTTSECLHHLYRLRT